MNSIADQCQERRFNLAFITLFSLLFLAAPSYYQDNLGGEGLFLPFNNVVWLCVSFIIGLGFLKVLHSGRFRMPGMLTAMLIFLATTTFLGLYESTATPVAWLFRSLAIWGGVLFFVALAQFSGDKNQRENLLCIIMASAAIQAGYGLIQIIFTDPLPGWLPQSPGVPRGIFQQQNLNASYSATGFIIALYLVFSSSFQTRHPVIRFLPYLAGMLTVTTIITAGSRVGMLGLGAGVLLLLISRTSALVARGPALIVFAVLSIAAGFGTSALESRTGGLESGFQKLENTATSGNIRVMIYDTSWQLFTEKPLLGYGIGQFEPVWHQKKAEYHANNPGTTALKPRLSHPHNELLYWAIEGGSVALAGILTMVVSFLWLAFRSGWTCGLSGLALLLPITLHTQVELPFYISQLHWMLFITLILLATANTGRTIAIRLSSAARILSLSLVLALPVLSSVFVSHSLASINAISRFISAQDKDISTLEFPSKNLYFNRSIAATQMQILLQLGLQQNNKDVLHQYVEMAQKHLRESPEPLIFNGLVMAYHRLGDFDASHAALARALAIYPQTPEILRNRDRIMRWDKKEGIFERYWRSVTSSKP